MNSEQKELLLKEYEYTYEYRIAYSQMRLLALGGQLTLLGIIISKSIEMDFPPLIAMFIMSLVVVYSSIRVISALNRGIFVFSDHAKWVEERVKIFGFSTYWRFYLKESTKDSGSHAFVIASRMIDVTNTLFIIIITFIKVNYGNLWEIWNILGFIVVVLSLTSLIINEIHISKELDPKGFQDRIYEKLSEARNKAIANRE